MTYRGANFGAFMGTNDFPVTATFGGGTGVVSPYFAPSMGLSYSEAIDAAGFGNDRSSGAPVRITFAVPMNSAGVHFLYQDPAEDGRGNEYGVRLSSGNVKARFFDANGTPIGDTSGLTDGAQGGYLGGNFEGNNPQGAVRVSAPIAAMEISMPASYGSEAWLVAAVPAGQVNYQQIAADAVATNNATNLALEQLQEAAKVGLQAQADALSFTNAARMAAKANWLDGGTRDYAASAKALSDVSRAIWQTAVTLSDKNDPNLLRTTAAQPKQQVADVKAFFQAWQPPTLPADLAPRVAYFADLLAGRSAPYVPITVPTPRPGATPAPQPAATVVTTGPSNMMAPDTQLYVVPEDAGAVTPALPYQPSPAPTPAPTPMYGVTPYPGAGPTNDVTPPATPAPTTEPASSSGLTSPLLIGLALLGGWALLKGKNRRREF
jgi:hypothetical protein